jgi:hypothetical protein
MSYYECEHVQAKAMQERLADGAAKRAGLSSSKSKWVDMDGMVATIGGGLLNIFLFIAKIEKWPIVPTWVKYFHRVRKRILFLACMQPHFIFILYRAIFYFHRLQNHI